MKIIYGVSGEGSGHSSRAKVVGGHLLSAGHEVRIVTYDRGLANLKDEFEVHPTEGLTIISIDNKVSKTKTLIENLGRFRSLRRSLQRTSELFDAFQPDCVVTDFEPTTAWIARRRKLPLVSIDNQHRMRYMRYPQPEGLWFDELMTKNVIRAMIPKPWVSLITTFHEGETIAPNAFLFPPIVREVARRMETSNGQHVLIYVTDEFNSLIDTLKQFPEQQFVFYGYDRETKDENVRFKRFSNQGFLNDLASSRAVMGTAGFTLISEAMYLKKPYLALPMNGQYEQHLNAHMLSHHGLGAEARTLTAEAITDFLGALAAYQARLESIPVQDNSGLLDHVDRLLENDMTLLRGFDPTTHSNRWSDLRKA